MGGEGKCCVGWIWWGNGPPGWKRKIKKRIPTGACLPRDAVLKVPPPASPAPGLCWRTSLRVWPSKDSFLQEACLDGPVPSELSLLRPCEFECGFTLTGRVLATQPIWYSSYLTQMVSFCQKSKKERRKFTFIEPLLYTSPWAVHLSYVTSLKHSNSPPS